MERQNVLLIALLLLFLFSSGCARYDGLLDLRPDEAVELADVPFFLSRPISAVLHLWQCF